MTTAIADFVAAVVPPEHGGPPPSATAALIERYLDRLPTSTRRATLAGFASINAYLRVRSRTVDPERSNDERARLLDQLAGNPIAGDGVAALKAIVLMASGAEQARAEMTARATASPVARPDAELDVTTADAWPSASRCDVIVVGSGAGGAMAARTLARAGLETVVVEEGRRFGVEEFRTGHPLDRFGALYRAGGATFAFGRPPIALPIGRGVGGTTLVNSGTCFRTPRSVLLAWRDDDGFELADPDRFEQHLDDAEATLRVAAVPDDVMGRNGRTMLRGADALRWAAEPLRRNAPGCVGSCQCAIGCPRNAKLGVHLNALPQACEAGARILSEARVERLLHEHRRVTGILVRRHDGSVLELRAPLVVVAAGATETPLLLRRSGLGRHPGIGRNLSVHPAVSAAGRFDHDIVGWEGVLQSAVVDEFHDSDGILVEATATPPGMGSMLLPGFGRPLMDELEDVRRLATLGAMIADEPSGRVHGRTNAVLTYRLTRSDAIRLRRAVRIMAELLFAAGAVEVLPSVPGLPRVRSLQELDRGLAEIGLRHLHLAAFHPTGSVTAGGDPQRHPVGPDGRLRGVGGVVVADASVLPSCPGVNPQISIMAVALAISTGVAGHPGSVRSSE